MTIYSSNSVRGFFDSNIHPSIPEDAVELSVEEHKALIDGQSEGKVITFPEAGKPFLAEQPKPTREQELARIRVEREVLFDTLDKAEMIATRRKNKALIAAIQTEKERLCNLPVEAEKLSDEDLAEFHATLNIEV